MARPAVSQGSRGQHLDICNYMSCGKTRRVSVPVHLLMAACLSALVLRDEPDKNGLCLWFYESVARPDPFYYTHVWLPWLILHVVPVDSAFAQR